MKIFILSIFLFFLHFSIKAESTASSMPDSQDTTPQKRVLIINSYHPESKWSEKIVTGIKTILSQQFQDLHLYSGNLNIEEAQTEGTTLLSLRAIIWQMAETEGDTINPTNQQMTSFYRIRKLPDVIVFIGEESFFEHISLHLWQEKWSNIPIVCCAMNDSITREEWYPGRPIVISDLQPTQTKILEPLVFKPKTNSIKERYANSKVNFGIDLSDKARKGTDGEIEYVTRYHSTGVLAEIPVRKNLELLKSLMPKLKEIVWVDDRYYKNAYALHKLQQELPHILPDVNLTVIHHNGINTDSIYNVMLQPVDNRVFITYAWNINGIYSRLPEQQIDSLFSHSLTSPILTLTEKDSDKNYWLGGIHITSQAIIEATANQISQILNGVPADSIPFLEINQTETYLNAAALKHFGLLRNAPEAEGIIYRNIPPSFYKQHERAILISILAVIILSGATIMIVKRIIYTKKIQAEYINYHRLYKRLQAIYQNSDIDFALYDENGILISRIVNGQEETDLPSEILPDDLYSTPLLSQRNKQMLLEHQTINKEIDLKRQDTDTNETSKWNLIIKPLQNPSEQKACYIAIALDLTPLALERRSKERSEHILQFATQTADMGVASYNLLTGKGFASPTWFQNLNEPFHQDQLPTYENVCEEDRSALSTHLKRVREENIVTPFIRIIQVKDALGKIHYIQEYIFVREYAPKRGVIIITELNLNYDEPQQKENALRKAKEEAETSNLETEQFLANISHEIRTPLNAIVGFSSILANSVDKEDFNVLPPIVEQNNKLLIALIDNILYLSKLDSGTLAFDYTPADLKTLFNTFVSYAQEQIESKNITIETDIPQSAECVYISETLFNLVMNNLISNAAKFTSRGTITIGYEKREHEYYFFVKDTGCGIDSADQENIFKRFNKLNAFTQGTGLGLALCHSIVIHQDGQIGVVSKPGEGSVFWFTLPIPPEAYS